jgi:hypothetical protein
MSASYLAEELQKLLRGILKALPFKPSEKRCSSSDSTTRGRLCDPCMQLNAVDAKLYAHLEEINKLLKTKAEVEQRVNQHHDPLIHLPVEISSHIFTLYTEDLNSAFGPGYSTYGLGPLLLGAVSKFWRWVAFNTPHLWNTIKIIFSNDNLPMKVGLTKEWLDRSGQLPLHLSLHQDSNVVKSELIALFNELQHVSPRWRTLFLDMSASLYPTFLGEVTCAPTLETLTFFDTMNEEGDFHLPHTPSLKHLDIQVSIPFSFISIDWGNLTTVHAYRISMGRYFDILRLCEGLECFRLGHPETDEDVQYPLPTTPLTHSALRELYLETSDEFSMPHSELVTMLDLVVFPSLEKFGYDSEDLFPNSAIPSIFNRSRCQLTHFDLCGDLRYGTTDDLIAILSDLLTITHFKLEDEYSRRLDDALMSNELLRRLTPIHPSEFGHTDRLLPRLESLEFVGYKAFSWSCLAGLLNAVTFDGGSNLRTTPEAPEYTNSIRRISFGVYAVEEMEQIDTQCLVHFKGAHRAGIFRCQVLRDYFRGRNIGPFSWEYDLS